MDKQVGLLGVQNNKLSTVQDSDMVAENLEHSCSVVVKDLVTYSTHDTCGVCGCTTSGRYVRIIDLREGNEESSEETTGCKASVYAEFDDCPRVGKFVKLLDFRHFERHMMFSQSDRKTYKKAISDGVNVSVVLDVGCGNT